MLIYSAILFTIFDLFLVIFSIYKTIIIMKAITQRFFSFTNSCLKQLIVIVACIFLQACEARHYWVLIIYDQNSLVTTSFIIVQYLLLLESVSVRESDV